MTPPQSGKWEVLLADLALILFIVALGGLVTIPRSDAAEKRQLETAPSQALYRSVEGGPSLGDWLAAQTRDPRMTLTIFVEYQPENASVNLARAAEMIDDAEAEGVPVRTVLRTAQRNDIYASLAFDTVQP